MITRFKGKYDFLDTAYYCLAGYAGVIYNSAEAAFLASQYDDPYFRSMFRNTALPIWRARELGQETPEALRLDTRAVAGTHAADHSRQILPLPESPLPDSWLRATSGSSRKTTGTNNSGAVASVILGPANTDGKMSALCRAATTLERF